MKKILLAEDDRNLSRSMDTWLTLEGFQVITVFNGEEALNKVKNQQYDLLITDISMPRLNGIELINKIRKIDKTIPIMVVSGKLDHELIADLRKMAVKYILPKPIKPVDFRNMIGQLFPGLEYS
ncbi:MAG TPA: response regulator [Calditrichia bacterium]|nr:response regulator [Calditrichia bacterium]HQV32847.1 response regulator [Calditrichia bacterium]